MKTLITFEGIDGSGKTTLLGLVSKKLQEAGVDTVATSCPYGTDTGKRLHDVVTSATPGAIPAVVQSLIYAAALKSITDEVIQPALSSNKCVLCDRYCDSSVVYQGYIGGANIDKLIQFNYQFYWATEISLTFLLDIPVETAIERIQNRDRAFNGASQGVLFRQLAKARQGYLELAKVYKRYRVISTDRTESQILNEIYGQLEEYFIMEKNRERQKLHF